MAKKAKVKVNDELSVLKRIADNPQGYDYVAEDEGKSLVDKGLIDINLTMKDGNGRVAARLTESGKTMLNPVSSDTAIVPQFEIMTNVAIPPSRKGNRKGSGAPARYPFDALPVGGTFFVPVTADMPNPLKTLGSTVSNANKRYAKDTGQVRQVTVAKRGKGNKALLDDAGNKIMETKTVPVLEYERKFVIRPMKAGDKAGDWSAPSDGVLIGREK